MLITRARLKGQAQLHDIIIDQGLITSLTPTPNPQGPTTGYDYDAHGKLTLPAYVEPHIHLDYANTAGTPRENTEGTLFEAITIWGERKELGLQNKQQIKENAYAAARACAEHGTGYIRSHVDVTDPDLTALHALLELKEEIKDWCTLQIVAFPQNGIIAYPGGKELMRKAMDLGADVVGGIPHLEPTYLDGVESVRYVFDLAEEYGALVDIHCDEIDDANSRFLEVMAAETTRRGMQGKVTASHVVAMAYYGPGYMARLLPKLQEARINFAICPRENLQLQGRGFQAPVPRGVAPVAQLVEAGLHVGFAQDSIADPWYPVGDGNPLRNLDAGLHIGHMLTPGYLADATRFITEEPAHNLNLHPHYGIAPGTPANLIIVDAHNDYEAVQYQARVLCRIHQGTINFTQEPRNITWAT